MNVDSDADTTQTNEDAGVGKSKRREREDKFEAVSGLKVMKRVPNVDQQLVEQHGVVKGGGKIVSNDFTSPSSGQTEMRRSAE